MIETKSGSYLGERRGGFTIVNLWNFRIRFLINQIDLRYYFLTNEQKTLRRRTYPSVPDNERRENGKRRRSETYIPVSLHAGRCSVSKLCISITKTASAALLVFADRSCACRLHTTWAHVLPARWNETWFAHARICVRVCVHRFHTTVQWHRMATSEISDAEARGLVIIPKHSN